MVWYMMSFVTLPISFWGYALKTACYVLNRIPSKFVNETPYEILIGHKPVLSHLKIWGYPAYIKYLKIDKLGPRSNKCLFVGNPKETKRYYFYLAEEQKVSSAIAVTRGREGVYERTRLYSWKGVLLMNGVRTGYYQ